MMKRFLFAFLLSLIMASPAIAAPQPASGTITLATTNPTYQQPVFFDYTLTGKLKGYQYPMFIVDCYQGTELVYRELGKPTDTFVLGGGWSLWVSYGGGDALCNGQLWIYSGLHSDAPFRLASTPEFKAEG